MKESNGLSDSSMIQRKPLGALNVVLVGERGGRVA